MTPRELVQEKVSQAVGILRDLGIDCWITFARETALNGDPILDYIVGTDLTWHSALIVASSGRTCAIVGEYDRRTVLDTGAYEQVTGYVQSIRGPFLECLARLRPGTIALNFSEDSEIADGITHGMYLTMVDMLRTLGLEERIVSAEPVVSALRQRKSAAEIALMREAIRHTEEIFDVVGARARAGMTERQVAELVREEVARRSLGFAWDAATCPAVFTGPDTAGAHYGPTDRAIEGGHVVNMDFGVRCGGYVSDLQRTWYVRREGETAAPEEVQRGFDTIRRSIEAARAALTPGTTGLAVDGVARGIITGAGYEEFPHALGHQVGRFAHDGTALLGPAWEKYGRKPHAPLEEGMVFTIEPRLTVAGRGVVTIEEMAVIREAGAEYLSRPQTALRLLPAPPG